VKAASVTSSLRGRAREEAILAATAALITEVGYERISMDAVAARASASKATIYGKWPGKAPLVAEALRRQADAAAPEIADTGSLRGDLRYAVDAVADALTGKAGGLSLVGLTDAVKTDPDLRDLVRDQIERRSTIDGTVIAGRAASRGERLEPADVAHALRVAVAQLFLAVLLGDEPPGADVRQHLVDDVLIKLLARDETVR
jgi:AcrR family transcriptional regulator